MPNVATAEISPEPDRDLAPDGEAPLQPGESVVARAEGVVLGWQLRTILIWWLPGLMFIALGQVQFRSWVVTAGLFAFCALLFAFYASDSEVRPRASRKRYVLTDRRLLTGVVRGQVPWRTVELREVAGTRMEKALVDRAVARLSGAATIVLEMRDPGPRGQPRRLRIGPMRAPDGFRDALELRLGHPGDQAAS